MANSSAFIPGSTEALSFPLQRFYPPINRGVVQSWLAANVARDEWVLDPFGASPQVALEAAQAGYKVLVAANNPITRFLLEMLAKPPKVEEFQAALADLASTRRGDERLEPHILDLYSSECPACKQMGFARAFIWEHGAKEPHGKLIHCEKCGHKDEHPVDEHDLEKASKFRRGGAHRARALERIASSNDPNRKHAAEALESYQPRAVYALFTILNRMDSLRSSQRHLALIQALMLVALDRGNNLWEHPSGRPRPKQLSNPPIFREHNIWHELEDAITLWSTFEQQIEITEWPNVPTNSGGISLFKGSFRKLADQLGELRISKVVSALPRPNQAFWTLSALWSGWLWGRESIGSFGSVLRRRRYDWRWHTEALQANLGHLEKNLEKEGKIFALVGESEAGFNAAAIIAGNLSGLSLEGLSLRREKGQLQIHWKKIDKLPAAENIDAPQVATNAAIEVLNNRSEPSHYEHLYSAALIELSKARNMGIEVEDKWEIHSELKSSIEIGLSFRGGFLRYGGSSHSLQIGQWWLNKENKLRSPLADRLEIALVRTLIRYPGLIYQEIDESLCKIFPGLLTPPSDLIDALLRSYAVFNNDGWTIKADDQARSRRNDLAALRAVLSHLGKRLSYKSQGARNITWIGKDGKEEFHFHVIASGIISEIIFSKAHNRSTRKAIVVPGSRSQLILKKIARDPRLQQALAENWQIVKFRHIRRLAENESLTKESFLELLDLDPLSEDHLQAPLL